MSVINLNDDVAAVIEQSIRPLLNQAFQPHAEITVVIRDPRLPDSYIVISRDSDLAGVIAALQHLAAKRAAVRKN